jgi:hypothetical protein
VLSFWYLRPSGTSYRLALSQLTDFLHEETELSTGFGGLTLIFTGESLLVQTNAKLARAINANQEIALLWSAATCRRFLAVR